MNGIPKNKQLNQSVYIDIFLVFAIHMQETTMVIDLEDDTLPDPSVEQCLVAELGQALLDLNKYLYQIKLNIDFCWEFVNWGHQGMKNISNKRPKQNPNFASLVSRIAPDALAELFQQGSEPSATGGADTSAKAGRWDGVVKWPPNPNLSGKIFIFF